MTRIAKPTRSTAAVALLERSLEESTLLLNTWTNDRAAGLGIAETTGTTTQ